MHIRRRASLLFIYAAFASILLLLHETLKRSPQRNIPQAAGLGEVIWDGSGALETPLSSFGYVDTIKMADSQFGGPRPSSLLGFPPAPSYNYTKVLVMPKLKEEQTDWTPEETLGFRTAIYHVDDPSAALRPPINKGNEVMVYLTYIIDHYEDLPDIIMFMHSHRFAWHNNNILNHDAYEIITRLSSERVIREGYMNLRCHWNPGCPDWIHPGGFEDEGKPEQTVLANVWSELFPLAPVPPTLAQPCCGQFAVSRERVHSNPKAKYVFYRDWLLETSLGDYLSGRVWEYLWHFVFTGQAALCPDQHICYCDGYGVCFEDDKAFDYWFELKWKQQELEKELAARWSRQELTEVASRFVGAEVGKDVALKQGIAQIQQDLDERRDAAISRGKDPQIRATIAGREWHNGDWY